MAQITRNRPTIMVELPSEGKPYGGKIPAVIGMHPMRAQDEKLLLGAGGPTERNNAINTLLKNCLTDDQIDVNEMTTSDRFFLMLQLRVQSYGDKYDYTATCQACRHRFPATCNLSEFPEEHLPEGYSEPWSVHIEDPDGTETVYGIRLLRGKDEEQISRAVARIKNPEGDEAYLLRLQKQIMTVDGMEIPDADKADFVRNAPANHCRLIQAELEKIDSGIVAKVTLECPKCGVTFESGLPVQPGLFRP